MGLVNARKEEKAFIMVVEDAASRQKRSEFIEQDGGRVGDGNAEFMMS